MAAAASSTGAFTISALPADLPLCLSGHLAEVICLDCRALFCGLCAFHHLRYYNTHSMFDLKDLMSTGLGQRQSDLGSSASSLDSRLAPPLERTRSQLATPENAQASTEELLAQFVSATQEKLSFGELEGRIRSLRFIIKSHPDYLEIPPLDEPESALSVQTNLPNNFNPNILSIIDGHLCEIETHVRSKKDAVGSLSALFDSLVSAIGKDKLTGMLIRLSRFSYIVNSLIVAHC